MRANRVYDLKVTKGPGLDHIEVIDITDLEVVLFWDTRPGQTGRLARALRADLAQLEDRAFIAKWEPYSV